MWRKYWRIVGLGIAGIIGAIMMLVAAPFALLGGLAWLCGMRTKGDDTRVLEIQPEEKKRYGNNPSDVKFMETPDKSKNPYDGFGQIPKTDDQGDSDGPAINSHSFGRKK